MPLSTGGLNAGLSATRTPGLGKTNASARSDKGTKVLRTNADKTAKWANDNLWVMLKYKI